jgi:hypothetical protein
MDFTNDELVCIIQALVDHNTTSVREAVLTTNLLVEFTDKLNEQRM